MLLANPLATLQTASLYPTNVYFIDCLSTKPDHIHCGISVKGLSSSSNTGGVEILPNALHRSSNPSWRGGGFSLGVDLGASHTGLALGKGFCPRPLTVTAHILSNLATALLIRLRLSIYWVLCKFLIHRFWIFGGRNWSCTSSKLQRWRSVIGFRVSNFQIFGASVV